jgi:type II secretory pathway pseudopilin PulG
MLTVLAIMGILAALVVPVLKNVGHADATLTAGQQMLGDIGRARQLAMSQRTTVYVVFLPEGFWTSLSPAQLAMPATTNLAGDQLTGYAFIAYGATGDQPGQHLWHYLTPWQSLPDGTFIPLWKFSQATPPFTFTDPIATSKSFSISPFDSTNGIPFPTETNNPADSSNLFLPYLAFNYLGQLISSGKDSDPAGNGQDIPLARGGVSPAFDPATRTFVLSQTNTPAGLPQVVEVPPGNSTNAYNLIHIDPLTGRATLEQPKIQ